MRVRHFHAWQVSAREAIRIQEQMRGRILCKGALRRIRTVAGADVSVSRKTREVWAGIVVMRLPGLEKVEERWACGETSFPYIPGLLSFRELPILLDALKKITTVPDVMLCDGQGTAHPRGLGLASHLGLLIEVPTIGCAKSRLVGTFSPLGQHRGDRSPLLYRGEEVGRVLRTRSGVRPLFVSPGNRIDLDTSTEVVLRCCSRYRIPEPIRQAHLLVNALRRHQEAG